jgi:hypothetical protein
MEDDFSNIRLQLQQSISLHDQQVSAIEQLDLHQYHRQTQLDVSVDSN